MTIYAVVFTDVDGNDQVSRLCQTIRAARSWCKWLRQCQRINVRIYKGGVGGMVVE